MAFVTDQHTLRVQIHRLPGSQDLPLPAYQSSHAAGMDLHAAVDDNQPVTIAPGRVALIPCGFAMALPDGFEAQIRPRSGLAVRSAVTLVNSPGTIDADYRGQVQVPLINHGSQPFQVTRGMRIAQMIISPVRQAQWVQVQALDATARGQGGFGHTGQ